MAQYLASKQRHPDALLLFRMGDFYELFFEDAKEASRALGITLTSRSKGDGAIPMAGVPVRALDGYLKRLVAKGYRVAICEQMQDPREAKGVVEREVIRVVTPGTLTEDGLLDEHRANHLAAIVRQRGRCGIAWVELSTGAFRVTECDATGLVDELGRIDAAELLVAEDAAELIDELRKGRSCVTRRAPFEFGHEGAQRALLRFFKASTLDGFGIGELRLAVGAAGALIGYLEETQLAALPHITRIEVHRRDEFLFVDRATRTSLELVETMRGDGQGTPLLSVVDETRTPMGARLLREWLLAPLAAPAPILTRQGAVAELVEDGARARSLHEALGGVLDLERLTTRVSCGRANARDLVALRTSLERMPELLAGLDGAVSTALARIASTLDPATDLAAAIASCIVDEPPLQLTDGGVIRAGHSAELDELRSFQRDGRDWLARFQAREAERLGIGSLKVGFNKVFGYYIEITHAHRKVELPPEYERKQTTKNAERYVTAELRDYEKKVLHGEERSKALEHELFVALRSAIAAHLPRLQATAALVAELDVYVGLARVARDRGYCRPTVDDSTVLEIEDGRHPVIEATHASGTFVPNDTRLLPPERQLVLLTGPNMAGKSTYIRQNALIVLLAQVGSFVPARSARVGVVDRIFTRVGASDDISRGASTFMVEMTETANILNNARRESLVILDEVGRGTSTFDGLALAWAIAEELHRIGCRALFATHYHQLTDLAADFPGVVNQRVAVREWGDEIVFLHRIEDGATDRSYGLHVGRLAGLPPQVLSRAREVLELLEAGDEDVHRALAAHAPEPSGGKRPRQLALFQSAHDRVLAELEKIDADALTPLDALQRIAAWRQQLRGT